MVFAGKKIGCPRKTLAQENFSNLGEAQDSQFMDDENPQYYIYIYVLKKSIYQFSQWFSPFCLA